MSASPPKDAAGDVEQTEENSTTEPQKESMERNDDQNRGEGPFNEFDVKEQDRWLPIANVARIMKNALPENAKIAKEAKECMQECVSEFISFITSEASEKCQHEKRKTVNGEDILFAMNSLGFENYAEALKIYLTKYRETLQNRADQQQREQQPGQSGQAQPQQGQVGNSSNNSNSAAASGNAAAVSQFSGNDAGASSMMPGDSSVDYGMATGDGSHEPAF